MVGQASDSNDHYVSGGVNWAGFTLPQLVAMVAEQASVPQLERLAQDWRETGDGVADAADYLAESLDDLMNYWTGESAEKARHTVALNAQWVSDLGTTAREMGAPIEEAAGALKAAQEAMPALSATEPAGVPGAAPQGAAELAELSGSPLGAAVGATAAGSESGFAAQAEQAELKRVAVETMQRFEAAAVGIDRSTPLFLGQDTELRPEPDEPELDQGESQWISAVTRTSGVDMRWQVLTGLTDPISGKPYPGGGFGTGGSADSFAGKGFGGMSAGVGGFGAMPSGPVGGRTGRGGGVRSDVVVPGRGVPTAPAGAVIGGAGSGAGGAGMPMGAAPMGAGLGAGAGGAQPHRRRFPFDADDPFDTGQKASPPVIGL